MVNTPQLDSLQPHEGLLPNLDLGSCTRDQLQAAFPGRLFPCNYSSSNSHNSIESASQLHRELTAEQIAALQQGSAAWHLGRNGHITGSTVTDLLGFDCPAINRLLAAHGVYHAVKDGRQGIAKLQAATAKLRGEAATATTAASHMGPFGMLCCEFGNRHEASGLHTLMSCAPPGAVLIDSGFVTLTPQLVASNPAFYDGILDPSSSSSSSRSIGSLGNLDASLFSELRIGCSVDGMLAVPAGVGRAGQRQQPLVRDAGSIRRAPPYSWISEAGYKAAVVEVKCPTPYYPVSGKPWAFGVRGSSGYRPYKCMKAHYYCQAQLNMLVTGTELCVFVVWTRARTWLLHIPANKPWLHALLHLLRAVHSRHVAPYTAPAGMGAAADELDEAAAAAAASGEGLGEDQPRQQQRQQPADNLFWCDADLALRGLYRRFITHTAQLCAAMSSEMLPDPVFPAWGAQQQQQRQWQRQEHQQQQPAAALNTAGLKNASTAQQRSMLGSAPPPGWEASANIPGKPAAAAAVAGGGGAPCWVFDGRLGLHHAMVRSVHLPWHRQQPLQRDRWFLDRCDPHAAGEPCQAELLQAWLQHPLLDHLAAQPQAMLTLLHRLHLAAPAPAPTLASPAAGSPVAAAGSAVEGNAAAAVAAGGVSPGALLLAMLLKMEQANGLRLDLLWHQLPPCARRLLLSMKQALLAAAGAGASLAACTAPSAASADKAAGAAAGGGIVNRYNARCSS
ncbi:hypothetical protein COO60DRAFT_689868 [Scenedesmus sp. NREL 46B-D3]|nr:hypothetical protein COO60DRAFT_689868 [Scenedesmus sp. NREL 46B-D3]